MVIILPLVLFLRLHARAEEYVMVLAATWLCRFKYIKHRDPRKTRDAYGYK